MGVCMNSFILRADGTIWVVWSDNVTEESYTCYPIADMPLDVEVQMFTTIPYGDVVVIDTNMAIIVSHLRSLNQERNALIRGGVL